MFNKHRNLKQKFPPNFRHSSWRARDGEHLVQVPDGVFHLETNNNNNKKQKKWYEMLREEKISKPLNVDKCCVIIFTRNQTITLQTWII